MNIRTNKKKRRENNPLFYIFIIMRENMVKIGKKKEQGNTNKNGKIKKGYIILYIIVEK